MTESEILTCSYSPLFSVDNLFQDWHFLTIFHSRGILRAKRDDNFSGV
jgi:hypothetical protein